MRNESKDYPLVGNDLCFLVSCNVTNDYVGDNLVDIEPLSLTGEPLVVNEKSTEMQDTQGEESTDEESRSNLTEMSVIKHNRAGRVMQMAVLLEDFDKANNLLDGNNSTASKYGEIRYYEDEDVISWEPQKK